MSVFDPYLKQFDKIGTLGFLLYARTSHCVGGITLTLSGGSCYQSQRGHLRYCPTRATGTVVGCYFVVRHNLSKRPFRLSLAYLK